MASGKRKTGGIRKKATLKYSEDVYTPAGLQTLTEREMRKEYSRLRSIARKRLERFENTEWTDSQVYRLNAGKYIPIKQIKSDRDLRHLLSDLARFITAETGSVSGLEAQRKRSIKTFNERGYTFVDKNNFKGFTEFMEYARVANLNRLFDSKRIADFYEFAEMQGMKNEQLRQAFRKWSKNQRKQTKIQNKDPRSSGMYRNEVD